jgi:ATP-binding cassette subfamily B protein/subfamily B ATP-binding cassette protein MsbA
MENFVRAVRVALKYRMTLLGAFLCSLSVAILWGGNIGTVYPFIEVVLRGDSPHKWCADKVHQAEKTVAEVRASIDQIEQQQAGASADEQRHLQRQADYQQSRLRAEQRALAMYRWLQPIIRTYLPDDPFKTLVLVILFLLLGTLLKDVFLVGNSILISRLVQLTTLDLRNQFYRHTLDMDLKAFGQKRTSGLLSRFTTDLGALTGGIGSLFGDTMREPLKMIVCLIGAAVISWRLLVLSLIFSPLAMLLTKFLARSIKRANRRTLEETAVLYGRLAETFTGIQAVKAFTMERVERSRLHYTAKQLYRRAMKLTLYGALTKPINELLGIAVVCLALLAGGYLVLNQETHLFGVRITSRPMTFGSMMAFFAFLAGVSDPARKLSGIFSQLQCAAAAADRIFPLLDEQPSIVDPPNPRSMPANQCALIFDRVNFHYLESQPVLQDINLHIPFGETVAIVGPNGCGKTTLVNLVPRFYDPVSGSVRLDYVDLREVRLRDLRKRIGMVTQQTFLFDETVANNIRYGSPHATDEEVIEAAKRAHAHRFIEEVLEDGYETIIGEHGGRLSGGQRQRISLARAMLRDPAILILDEATSQIDPESEQLIHKALEQFVRGRTAIIITHRMSTLTLADRIVVMDEGRIVDMGAHHELLTRCGLYGRLYQTEFRESA